MAVAKGTSPKIPSTLPELIASIDKEYFRIVEDAYLKGKDLVISNRELNHALILYVYLIAKAKKQICIFSGTLQESFFSNPIIEKSFVEAIKSKPKLKVVIVVQKLEKIPRWLDKLRIEKKVHLRELSETKEAYLRNHMIVVDNQAYRLEEAHELNALFKSDNYVRAIANFNDSKNAAKLMDYYNKFLIKKSVEV